MEKKAPNQEKGTESEISKGITFPLNKWFFTSHSRNMRKSSLHVVIIVHTPYLWTNKFGKKFPTKKEKKKV